MLTDAQIGLRIRAARNSRGVSAKALSLQLGWAPSRISRIERADVPLSVMDLQTIAEALGVDAPAFISEAFNI